MKILKITLIFSVLIASFSSFAQGSPDYTGGLKVKLNEDGSKYFRLISWSQFWVQHNNEAAEDESKTNFSIRRARVLAFSQITKDFLILTHFGLNSLNANKQQQLVQMMNLNCFFMELGVNGL